MKVCILVPAHNEEKRIGKTLGAYSNYFEKLVKNKKIEYKMVIVINNTKDKTEQVVKKYIEKNKQISYITLEKGGKGYAIVEGFKHSLKKEFDLIGFVDADMATKPEHFYELIKKLDNADGIIASRGLKKSVVKSSFLRRVNSRGFNLVVRLLMFLPFRDTQCGAKLFTREAVENVVQEPISTQWAFDVDLLYNLRKRGFYLKEIATTWEDKTGSAVKMITPFKMFSSIVRLRLLYSPFRFTIRLYDSLPERIKIHNL